MRARTLQRFNNLRQVPVFPELRDLVATYVGAVIPGRPSASAGEQWVITSLPTTSSSAVPLPTSPLEEAEPVGGPDRLAAFGPPEQQRVSAQLGVVAEVGLHVVHEHSRDGQCVGCESFAAVFNRLSVTLVSASFRQLRPSPMARNTDLAESLAAALGWFATVRCVGEMPGE